MTPDADLEAAKLRLSLRFEVLRWLETHSPADQPAFADALMRVSTDLYIDAFGHIPPEPPDPNQLALFPDLHDYQTASHATH